MSRSLPAIAIAACVLLGGCLQFPAPTPPTPRTKAQTAALAKCQQTIKKAQLSFIKTKLATLDSCVDGVLTVRLAFENNLATPAEFDAGIAKMRDKCTKGYGKITAASTKLVNAIVKSCTPVEDAIVGSYDALRFKLQLSTFGRNASAITDVAGAVCTATEEYADAQLWHAVPRSVELLEYLGSDFVVFFGESGLPNVPLDPRCLPLTNPVASPTPTPASTPSPTPTP